MRLEDRVALVTGGGSGIGQTICTLFAQEGAQIIVVDRYLERADHTATLVRHAGGDAIALKADVSNVAEVNAMAEQAITRYGRVDTLVNNAGISLGTDILTIDETTWDLNIAVVLKSVYLCSKALLPNMIANGKGVIVNISSVNGLTGIGEEAYSAAKAAVINLTKNLAVRYGRHQIRANVICPGTIETPIWGERVAKDPDVFRKLSKWYPLGRVGQPEDVANAALFLASDEASWITGTTLTVDGGLMAGTANIASELVAED
jgi:NAD(P)-dependent dehydrogenase (short-subunit alcohol dehydrogenase family)